MKAITLRILFKERKGLDPDRQAEEIADFYLETMPTSVYDVEPVAVESGGLLIEDVDELH